MLTLLFSIVCFASLTANALIIMGYYTAESAYSGYRIQDLPVRSITHLSYAFGTVTPSGPVTIGDEWASLKMDTLNQQMVASASCPSAVGGNIADLWRLKNNFPHLRTIFSIGGWGDNITASFQAASATNETRTAFVDSAVKIMLDYGFDGIDLDWEFPYGTGDNQQLLWLLQMIRAKLDTLNTGNPYALTISAAMVPKIIDNMLWKELVPILTWINVMSYDYSVDLTQTYVDSPLFPSTKYPVNDSRSIETTIKAYVDKGVPRNKLILGLPMYGQKYTNVQNGDVLLENIVVENGTAKQTQVSFKDITILRESSPMNWKEYREDSSKSLWIYNPFEKVMITYTDTVYSLPERLKYLQQQSLAGVMFWQFRFDSPNPKASFVSQTVSYLEGSATPNYKKFPVCAPLSTICNIQTQCSSLEWPGADSASQKTAVSGLFMLTVVAIALFLF
jgi:chitinase